MKFLLRQHHPGRQSFGWEWCNNLKHWYFQNKDVLKQKLSILLAQSTVQIRKMFSPTSTAFCSDKVVIEMNFVHLSPVAGVWTRRTSGWIFLYTWFISLHSLLEPSLSLLRYLTFIFNTGQISNIPQERSVITAQFWQLRIVQLTYSLHLKCRYFELCFCF